MALRNLTCILALSVALSLAVLATSVRAGAALNPPVVTCVDGSSFGITNATGACANDEGVQNYQYVAFVCNDGSLVQDPNAQDPCSGHQGIALQVDQSFTPVAAQPTGPSIPPGPVPVFPTNR
jgi:hypothetical protein